MKKFLAILALVAFLGGMSAPVLAADKSSLDLVTLADKDPKKKEAKKDDKKKSECTEKKSCCEEKTEKSCDTKK